MKSKIFGKKELEILNDRIKGKYEDPNGLWSRSTKYKIKEILTIWIPRMKELQQSLEDKRKK